MTASASSRSWTGSTPKRSGSRPSAKPSSRPRPPKFRAALAERTGAVKAELEEVRAAKHGCADPVERDQLEQRFHELEAQLQEGAEGGARRPAAGGLRHGARGLPPAGRHHRVGDRARPGLGHGAVRRAAHRRRRAAPGQDRGDGDRRRQDAGRHPAALSQRPGRPRRAPGHGEQLPGPPRLAVDGARLLLPRPHRRLPRRYRALVARPPRRLPGGHHLRHQQRVRLRLPARQHGVLARAAGPAGARLRHHRRGRLDPDRRGPDPAHHLRAGRQRDRRQVRPVQPPGGRAGPQADRRGEQPAGRSGEAAGGREDPAGRRAQAVPGPPGHAEEQAAAQAAERDRASSRWSSGWSSMPSPTASCRCGSSGCGTPRTSSTSCSTRRATRSISPTGAPRRCRPTIRASSWCPTSPRRSTGSTRIRSSRRTTGSSGAGRSRRTTPSRARSSTSSTSCSRPTSSTRRKWTIWCRTAR